MPRPIKFRVFYSGKMIFPEQFLCDRGEIKSCFHSDNEVPQIKGPNNDMGYEITQFTGLLDKNGKEIYESDVVKFSDIGYGVVNGKIKFDRCGFCIFYKAELSDVFLSLTSYEVEVIGNIYENPDLIPPL